jgi:hypothetical protein
VDAAFVLALAAYNLIRPPSFCRHWHEYLGRWHIVETPGYDMAVATAYILFDEDRGEFAFDCLTDCIHGAYDGDAIRFGWQGNHEMEPADGDGWAELRDDGSLRR